MRSRRACAMLVVPLAVLATACGGGSSGGASSTGGAGGSTAGTGAPGQVIDIPISDSGFLFTKTSATASAGVVTLRAVNPQSVAHDISIKGNGVDAQGNQVSNGGVSQVTATLTPGTYEYYCSVPGHEQAGMKGTLTVS